MRHEIMQQDSSPEWMEEAGRVMDWLCASIEANQGKGAAAFYSRIRYPLRGWAPPYPETTGYIIETLLEYYRIAGNPRLLNLAISCADWLTEIQMNDGAFMSLYARNPKPSVFNTGMILFGLKAAWIQTGHKKYHYAMENAVNWLVRIQEDDGSWTQGAYKENYFPAYFSRVLWAILECESALKNPEILQAVNKGLQFYGEKFLKNGTFQDWGFDSGKPAFTHTIAYTLRGFWECARLLDDPFLKDRVLFSAQRLMIIHRVKGSLAGSYDNQWNGDYSYKCMTGHLQLSLLASRIFEDTGKLPFRDFAEAIFREAKGALVRVQAFGKEGRIPGSVPFSGKYMPLRYPLWGAKFYLDACLRLAANAKTPATV